MEIGLRYWNGSAVVEIPVLADSVVYPIKIVKNGVTYSVPTVDISSPDALPIRVKLPSGIKALGYTVPIIPPDALVNSISFYVNDVFRDWDEVYGTVNIVDAQTGLPLSGVSVEISWTGIYNATVTAVTNGSGNASYQTPWVTRGLITLTVNKVTIGGVDQVLAGTLSNSVYVS